MPRTRMLGNEIDKSELLLCLYGKLEGVDVLVWVPRQYPFAIPRVELNLEGSRGRGTEFLEHISSDGSFNLPLFSHWRHDSCDISMVMQELIKIINLKSGSLGPFKDPPLVPKLPPKLQSKEYSDKSLQMPQLPPKPPKPTSKTPIDYNSILSLNPTAISSATGDFAVLNITSPITSAEGSEHTSLHNNTEEQASFPNWLDFDPTSGSHDNSHKTALANLKNTIATLSDQLVTRNRYEWEHHKEAIIDAIIKFKSLKKQDYHTLQLLEDAIKANTQILQLEIESLDTEIQKGHQFFEKQEYNSFDINKCIVAGTVALNQVYELVARDYAISDTIQLLSLMFNRRMFTIEVFIKKTRELSREQFLTRVHRNRIFSLLE